MKRSLLLIGVAALATLAVVLVAAKSKTDSSSKTKNDQDVAVTPKNETALASFEEPYVNTGESAAAPRFGEPLPGLAEVLAEIPNEDQRARLEESIESYRDAVGSYKTSLQELPPPVSEALLAGDEDTVAKAAAEDTSIIEKISTVQQRYTDVAKSRDAVTVAITAIGSPTVAADVNRILAILDSDLPNAEKFHRILEVILRRLQFLLEAIAAAETGSISTGLITGAAHDLDVVRGAFTRLVTGGDDGGGSSLEAYLPDGNKVDFQLPDDINLQRIEDLVNSENSIEFSVRDGQPTLRVVNPEGEVLLLISQPKDGPAVIIVD